MASWNDLVTCALLGTDRRPPPDDLPPSWAGPGGESDPVRAEPAAVVLSLAARHRTAVRSGGVLSSVPAPPGPPPATRPPAGDLAQDLLGRLLTASVPELVSHWLGIADARRLAVGADLWTGLAVLATRTPRLDRTLLARGLGERGIWFVRQNPAWSRLASELSGTPPTGTRTAADPPGPPVTPERVLADPDAIFAAPPPWPVELTRTALDLIGSGQLHSRGARYATRLGATMPWAHLYLRQPTADRYLDPDRPVPAVVFRLVRAALVALDETLLLRAQIDEVFDRDAPGTPDAEPGSSIVVPVELPPADRSEWTRPGTRWSR